MAGYETEERMDIATAYESICFRGDSIHPEDGQHDLRILVAEVVARLPEDVQDWLLYDTDHVFIGGSGQSGEFFELRRRPSEMKEGFVNIRIIFLSEKLADMPKDEALWTIAHEVAHSRLNHGFGGYEAEVEADRLVQEWGFKEPEGRAAERERYK
jgi:hypothetical protein